VVSVQRIKYFSWGQMQQDGATAPSFNLWHNFNKSPSKDTSGNGLGTSFELYNLFINVHGINK
jgi:hypothetical protein